MRKIDDAAIKINQAKTLMEILIEYRKSMPSYCQDNIIHVAFDILDGQENELIAVSNELAARADARRTGEQKENKTLQTV